MLSRILSSIGLAAACGIAMFQAATHAEAAFETGGVVLAVYSVVCSLAAVVCGVKFYRSLPN
jgi:hypothetical protein